jgi:hypothetical protein
MTSNRGRRVSTSGNLARWIGRGFCLLFGGAIALGLSDGYESVASLIGMMALALVVLFVLVRSFFWGIFLKDDQVVVVSWFRTYHVGVDDIQAIYDQPYNYLLNRGAGSVTVLSSRTRVVGFELTSIGRRVFPGTIASNRTQKAVLAELQAALSVPVVRLQSWDPARWFC